MEKTYTVKSSVLVLPNSPELGSQPASEMRFQGAAIAESEMIERNIDVERLVALGAIVENESEPDIEDDDEEATAPEPANLPVRPAVRIKKSEQVSEVIS